MYNIENELKETILYSYSSNSLMIDWYTIYTKNWQNIIIWAYVEKFDVIVNGYYSKKKQDIYFLCF